MPEERDTERQRLLLIADALITQEGEIPKSSQIESAVLLVAVAVRAKTLFTLRAASACLILR